LPATGPFVKAATLAAFPVVLLPLALFRAGWRELLQNITYYDVSNVPVNIRAYTWEAVPDRLERR
jgi:hypothetical protein